MSFAKLVLFVSPVDYLSFTLFVPQCDDVKLTFSY